MSNLKVYFNVQNQSILIDENNKYIREAEMSVEGENLIYTLLPSQIQKAISLTFKI